MFLFYGIRSSRETLEVGYVAADEVDPPPWQPIGPLFAALGLQVRFDPDGPRADVRCIRAEPRILLRSFAMDDVDPRKQPVTPVYRNMAVRVEQRPGRWVGVEVAGATVAFLYPTFGEVRGNDAGETILSWIVRSRELTPIPG